MLFGLDGVLAGQAMVERGLGMGRAATSTSPVRGVGKSVGGVTGSLEKALKTGQEPAAGESPGASGTSAPAQASSPETATVDTPDPPVVPAKTYEDPLAIQVGMANDELIRRFGPPALEVTGAASGRTLTYSGKNGVIQLEMRYEKVALIAAMHPRQAGVLLPAGPGFRTVR
jgi:hypothetical protein